jgi:DNA modification methylase
MNAPLRIEYLPLADLKPYDRNARTHSADQVAQIAASMRTFGWTNPILVDDAGLIIAGHGRLQAAREIGLTEAPVIRIAGLTEQQRRALTIADNKLGLNAGWDNKLLAAELHTLGDLQGVVGFSADELMRLLGGNEGLTDPDDAPPLPADPITQAGDLWLCGPHRLLCGDVTDASDAALAMDGQTASMLFTDPPYNVAYEGNYIQSGKILKQSEKIWLGGIKNDDRLEFSNWLSNVYRSIDAQLCEGASIYVWHPSGAEGRHFWAAWPWDDWHFQVDLVWNKTSLIISRWDYKPQHEPCMYGWKGKNRDWSGPNNEPTVWDVPRQQGASGEKRHHPTQKPVVLATRAISNHAAGIVFDPFLGSGTTLIAAEMTGRICHALEISPAYCDVAVTRWENFTGKKAERRPAQNADAA